MYEAKFYKKLKPPLTPLLGKEGNSRTVACELCNHFCQIKNEAVGICGVRKNINGELISLVYGYPVAINTDPIEKKPLFHFQPGSKTFSLGTLGCNFKCANCQNWGISQTGAPDQSAQPYFEPEKIIEQALKSNCQSIAYTYNEPTVFAEYALDIMKLARQNNLKNVWVSNGYMSESCLQAIVPYLDAANIDLKSIDEKFYKETCHAKLKPVLKNLIDLKKSGAHLEITTLVIPELSASPTMLKKIAKFIAHELGDSTPWHVSRFSPDVAWKLKSTPATPEEIILQAHQIGKQADLKYVYVGNVYNTDKENTYCPKCSQLAIKRVGYHITRYDNNGHCPNCGQNLDIIA